MIFFKVRAGSVCVCLIDDCGDNDMPLMEVSAHGEWTCLKQSSYT